MYAHRTADVRVGTKQARAYFVTLLCHDEQGRHPGCAEEGALTSEEGADFVTLLCRNRVDGCCLC